MNHLLSVGLFVSTLCVLAEKSEAWASSSLDEPWFSGESETGSGKVEEVSSTLPDSCTAEFRLESGHTMCLWDDPRVVLSGIGAAHRGSILDFHNNVRARVQPPATDITTLRSTGGLPDASHRQLCALTISRRTADQYSIMGVYNIRNHNSRVSLVWDDNLASVAEKWAKQCKLGHDKNRIIPSYGVFIGQNVAAGHRNWTQAMLSWYHEADLYIYGQDADVYLGPGGWNKIGHYTQLVFNSTSRLGCGYAECSGTVYAHFYVCNYAKGQTRTNYPYTKGERCTACPGSCSQGLCDCGGKVCLNKGKLDVSSCQCKCPSIYKGDNCSRLSCPERDQFYCGINLLLPDCEIYSNVPHLCPYMCGVCGVNGSSRGAVTPFRQSRTTRATTPSPLYVSAFNCTYRGLRPTTGQCQLLGDEGQDTQFCATHGGQFSCHDCDRYVNVKTDYCPVMCGVCEAPCGGLVCMNSGRLSYATCRCKCKEPFSGTTCEILTCPQADRWYCKFFSENYCFSGTFQFECPYFCGICD